MMMMMTIFCLMPQTDTWNHCISVHT